MELLSVEVCGENGAHYKVRLIISIDYHRLIVWPLTKHIFSAEKWPKNRLLIDENRR
jgi:hypothetical protein